MKPLMKWLIRSEEEVTALREQREQQMQQMQMMQMAQQWADIMETGAKAAKDIGGSPMANGMQEAMGKAMPGAAQ